MCFMVYKNGTVYGIFKHEKDATKYATEIKAQYIDIWQLEKGDV